MKHLVFFVFLVVNTQFVFTQEPVTLGEKFRFTSEILAEEREYWVYLPKEYNKKVGKKYPVLYLLDGDRNFISLVAINQNRQSKAFIIIAVLNTDRSRDFTPTNSLKRIKGYHPTSGGAEHFHRFLATEFRKHIDANYRTSGRNILLGHSFGGLFAMYSFLNHIESFDGYIALDPSLWWDNEALLKDYYQRWTTNNAGGKQLYIAQSGSKDSGDEMLKDPLSSFCHDLLKGQKRDGLNYKFEKFEHESHGNIVLPASLNAISFLLDE